MTRYFMTIPEAAALVLQAASLPDCGGRVMVLDMGEPIRVLDLARRFITLHGLEPEQDVPITFIGARPGEKLYEELAYASEDIMPTAHEAVRMWRGGPPAPQWIARVVEQLEQMRYSDDQVKIIAALRQAVPEMQPAVFGGSRPAPEPASSTMPGRPPLSRSA
jgi:FlaA1/EpsC-like NDP-sugar epimerase